MRLELLSTPQLPARAGNAPTPTFTAATAAPQFASIESFLKPASEAGMKIGQEMLAARRSIDTTAALDNAMRRMAELKTELDRDADYKTKPQRYIDGLRGIWDETSKSLDNVSAVKFHESFRVLARTKYEGVLQDARKEEINYGRATLAETANTLIGIAADARSKVERKAALDEIDQHIETAKNTGILDAGDALRFKKQTLGRFDELRVMRFMRTNPAAALGLLNNRAELPNLDELTREKLRNEATSKMEANARAASAELRLGAAEVLEAARNGDTHPGEAQILDALRRAGPRYQQLAKRVGDAVAERTEVSAFKRETETNQQKILAGDPAALKSFYDSLGKPMPADTHPMTGRPIIRNDDGSISTERSITVTEKSLNNGRPTNIPTIWDGKQLSDAEAIDRAVKSGQKFESFQTIDEAVKAAKARSDALGAARGERGAVRTGLESRIARKFRDAYDKGRDEFERDPLAYGVKNGILRSDAVKPLTWTDTTQLGIDFKDREAASEAMKEHFAGGTPPVLQPAEKKQFARVWDAVDADKKQEILAAAKANLSAPYYRQFLREALDGKPDLIAAGAARDPALGARIIRGNELKKAEGEKGVYLPKGSELTDYINRQTGDLWRANPEMRRMAASAAESLYINAIAGKQDFSRRLDRDAIDGALAELQPVTRFNGMSIATTAKDITEHDVRQVILHISLDQRGFGNGVPRTRSGQEVTENDLLRYGRPHSMAPGVYRWTLRDDTPVIVKDEQGRERPYETDMRYWLNGPKAWRRKPAEAEKAP